MKKFLTSIALLTYLSGYSLGQDSSVGSIDDAEYEVLAAVLAQEISSSSQGWVMLAPFTATFECNPPAHNGLAFGPCGGMRTQDQTPEEMLSKVKGAIPAVSQDLTTDLLRKSQQSVPITRTLPFSVKQFLVDLTGRTEPPYTGNPDLGFFPSRVGLNAERDRALCYAGVINWTDSSRSVGNFVYLEKVDSQWVIKGKLRAWSLLPK